MDKKIIYLLIAILVVTLLVLTTAGVVLAWVGFNMGGSGSDTAVPTEVAQVSTATAVPTIPPTAVLPTPLPQELPTNPPPPTLTPLPTATPAPTNTPTEVPPTPTPTATNTPVPVIVNTQPPPPPPPTATAPPQPTAPPVNTRGLSGTFSVEGGSSFGRNSEIWFNFFVGNNSGNPVPFSVLGVYPRKDGAPRPDFIQASWGGNNDSVPTSGIDWRDNIKISEPGNYTLQLGICFDASYQECRAGGGTWVFLSGEIPITVN